MTGRIHWMLALILLSVNLSDLSAQNFTTTGPDRGTLLLAGGAASPQIYQAFIELAGGQDARIVVIPTAAGRSDYSQNSSGAGLMRDLGARNVTVIHATGQEEANDPDFLEPLRDADAIWFGGGRQWRLVDAYAGTKAEELFWKVLERDGVIGGSSAGATIQGSYLVRGDTKTNQIMMGDHERGFGFIQNIAVDQHVIARNRHFDMYEILDQLPHILGIAIDEATAVVVRKNDMEVIGNSYVLIYDRGFWSREGSDQKILPERNRLFYFLRAGDRYDLAKRTMVQH